MKKQNIKYQKKPMRVHMRVIKTQISNLVRTARFWNNHHSQKIGMPNEFNKTGSTSGAGTAYPSGAPEFTRGFQWGSC